MAKPTLFKPELDKNHKYAVGVKIEGGGFAPFHSYATEEELTKAYGDWFKKAKNSGLHLPIACEKVDADAEWRNATCQTLPDIMQKVIDENRGDRN